MNTSFKIALGYIALIGLLFGSIVYIYKQMELLTTQTELEESISNRRKTTHQIINHLYQAEIIGQTLRSGKLDEYPAYKHAMQEARASIDSLQQMFNDTIQQIRLDSVRMLLDEKEINIRLMLEAMRENPADKIYRQQIDQLIAQQDSLLSTPRVQKKVVTHQNTYTIHHKPKKFFKRLAEVFSPGKSDSTKVNNVIQEVYTDTIEETYNPVDTIATILTDIQHKVFQTQQERQQMIDNRINLLRIAGSELNQRVTQILETIEEEEQKAIENRLNHEQFIRNKAANAMATISIIAVILVTVFLFLILRDITRSNHYRKELEKAKLYAENLLIAREKLMLTITHDIKAPAGSIIGYIDLLIRLIQDKRQLFYLQNMKSSANHLLDLVTSLLDYHRLEAGKMDLHPVAFKPHQLFETVYTSFVPLAAKKGLQLVFNENISPELTLEGDPFRIRQIVENLLTNALKFTEKGSIEIGIDYQGNQFIFSITDTGCGMTLQEQEKIFQEFTRLRSAQGQEGFGLGLSITKKLVELLKGKLTVESRPQYGSTFKVTMPLPSYGQKIQPKQEQIKMSLPARRQIRILLVDDDKIQLNLTDAMIRNLFTGDNNITNLIIRQCEQPEEFFEWIKTENFDLVLTDIQMPAMNGFELLDTLRKQNVSQAGTIPVIAITARSDMDEKDFQAKGFAGCLHKPFNLSDLAAVISRYINITMKDTTDKSHQTKQKSCQYNFKPLTEFSGDDQDAAEEIMTTFIQETQQNLGNIQKAVEHKDMTSLCKIAHKMLPIFSMIQADKALPSLQWLEERREEKTLTAEAQQHAAILIEIAEDIIQQAKADLSR
ncbi:ATP-binding protein [uncultured Bacteroides sp.]|jgi:signal transduction histidine kinase/CheY-like chemotaxis protein|uniref:hybrid sensor histidine kinase/response regulator n=1 Tax=uncultured Bacteroides sp. TaxID=162156 RepID=UPI00280B5CB0|nr:ATP-binding protein [uncultured Bacteroides sp.]